MQLRAGSRAQIVCPPESAYGSQGAGGVIPPDATLIFNVEVAAINPNEATLQQIETEYAQKTESRSKRKSNAQA